MTRIDMCVRCGRRLVITRKGMCASCTRYNQGDVTPALQRNRSVIPRATVQINGRAYPAELADYQQ